MPKFFPSISPELGEWALKQPVFFTGSAPIAGRHVNISPKGLPSSTFTIFSPNSCGYMDATGSGAETISHIYENRRCTIMFCSFGPSPRIMRFFCTGRVVEWDTPEFEVLLGKMGKKRIDAARAIIMLDVWKVQTSCGYGVPKLTTSSLGDTEKGYEAAFLDRDTLGHWASNKVERNEVTEYRLMNNTWSLDGIPGLMSARRDSGQWLWIEDGKAFLRRANSQPGTLVVGIIIGVLLSLFVQLVRNYLYTA
ncbi:Uncharacterized protein BP5553_00957 [Venustampulla echinocandica]|uniref:Pyridoxamine phosphate oxidase family protein n=1 Tax=Venustampulla echinocandica TaxID=2656787 RepID=A0A370TZQ2_9HELO|nr:Uncharacterized protein BP5553_00957 [Venustampulla echinocandica]RDL40978.1 Uncharacterized protein BP5553_00957 [Venustampulla echinocandica]